VAVVENHCGILFLAPSVVFFLTMVVNFKESEITNLHLKEHKYQKSIKTQIKIMQSYLKIEQ